MEPTFTPMSQATQPKEQPTLVDALETIGQGAFHASLFRGLSDLDRSDLVEFERQWPNFPETSRIRAIQVMDELAEENVDLNFSRALRACLDDPSPAVRQLAIDALWEDESTELVDRFLSILDFDESQDVRAAAAQALGKFADQASIGDLPPELGERLWTTLV